jgi:hypothetical protein
LTGPQKPHLDDAVFVDADDHDVAAVAPQARAYMFVEHAFGALEEIGNHRLSLFGRYR